MANETPYMIIAPDLLARVRRTRGFRQDLGQQMLLPEVGFRPKDDVVRTHAARGGTLLQKLGSVGRIDVYMDDRLQANTMRIYLGDKAVETLLRQWEEAAVGMERMLEAILPKPAHAQKEEQDKSKDDTSH